MDFYVERIKLSTCPYQVIKICNINTAHFSFIWNLALTSFSAQLTANNQHKAA